MVSSASREPPQASASACAVPVRISGTSPFRMSVVAAASSSAGTACCTACPVPSCGSWRTKRRPSPCACASTASAPWPMMTTVRVARSAAQASSTCCNRLRSARRCRTFGHADFIRVPLPAAMITRFRAMRRSTAKARIIGGLIACALALTGCSAVRIGYNQAPTLVWWWLDGYVDFASDQAPRVKAAIDRWFAWHRTTQLPDYADLLAAAQAQVMQPATAGQVCRWADELRTRVDVALMHAVPLAAELLPAAVGPEQLAHLQQRYRKSNESFKEDYLQPDPDDRLKASVKRAVDRAEMLYGPLDDRQRRLLAEGVAASPFDAAAWLAERMAVQAAVLATLTRLTAAGRADPAANLAGLRALAERAMRPPPGPYRDVQQRLGAYNCELVARLHNTTTAAQREIGRASC